MEEYGVVIVHGIGAGTGESRRDFSAKLKANVKKMVSSASDIVWEEADWEGVNDNIDSIAGRVVKRFCKKYIKEAVDDLRREKSKRQPTTSESSKNCIVELIKWVCHKLKLFRLCVRCCAFCVCKEHLPDVIDAAIDLPLYMQNPKQKEIRAKVREAISKAELRAKKVILVGHSLGSVIAFDIAVAELVDNKSSRLAALVTMGSPLNWVSEIRRAEACEKMEAPRIKSIPWINFWDPEDPVPEFMELDRKVFHDVQNIKVESKKKLISAHCNYWNDKDVAQTIAKMLEGNL